MEKSENSLIKKPADEKKAPAPVFVEAEKMFDRMAQISRETAQKAFEFFERRGMSFGAHLDDWLKAESELLRQVPVEITETKDTVNIRAAVAGFKPEEIEVSVKDRILFLSGETTLEDKKEDENTYFTEWRSNRFYRQLELPSEVESEGVEAQLKDGILRLSLKKKAVQEAEKIAVKAA